jgi:hypothetical protein
MKMSWKYDLDGNFSVIECKFFVIFYFTVFSHYFVLFIE